MRIQYLIHIVGMLLVLVGCKDQNKILDDLNGIKKGFLDEIVQEDVIESPFHIGYTFRTVFFSKEVVSLFGEIDVYNHLPHGWKYYEGKTLCKIDGRFREITLDDLFKTSSQKEFLRKYCEENLKCENEQSTYFSGENPLLTVLDRKHLHAFVVDCQFLVLIFQPYCVGGCGDGPFIVKIPYEQLKGHWNSESSLVINLERVISSQSFTSSWEQGEWIYREKENGKIESSRQ